MDIKKEEEIKKKKANQGLLICPIRGILRVKKYDAEGNYSEEYQRIRLIKHLLQKGYPKNQFIIEYSIPLGHKGHNTLRVDLAIKKEDNFLIVVEVKKKYTRENKNSAIRHQLVPAMRILNAKYGIYFDSTKQSRLLTRKENGELVVREFP
ncbi:10210_t:CDS:2 [Entrophospora sp. SA101]|nr:6495_t:CDS:2 [Entrophospora sp. SA101]CAJ0890260.1 10210_t:CDS:2 [Entrophospora sp. SA101]